MPGLDEQWQAVFMNAVRRPEHEQKTLRLVDGILREAGSSGRTFKSALLFCAADSPRALRDIGLSDQVDTD